MTAEFLPKHVAESRVQGKDKGKAIPLQAWTDLEGSRSMRLPDIQIIGT